MPHCGTEQETVQVTPLFPVSFATVAVNVVGLPAGTVETPEGATLTLIAGPAITGFPPPPQAASSITTANVESESTEETKRRTTPPPMSPARDVQLKQAMTGRPWPELPGRVRAYLLRGPVLNSFKLRSLGPGGE